MALFRYSQSFLMQIVRNKSSMTPVKAFKMTGGIKNTRSDGPRFDCSRRNYSIDDDGDVTRYKTTVTILNEEQEHGIFIDSYSSLGFLLSSGIRIMGPCAVFPRSILHWNVKNILTVNEDALSLFTMLEPKIDILLIGVGEKENLSKVNPNILKYLRSNKINVEILSTLANLILTSQVSGNGNQCEIRVGKDQALATFNFLNAEKRYVAGAFIPPSYINRYGEENDPLDPTLRKLNEGQGETGIINDDMRIYIEGDKTRNDSRKPGKEY